MAAPMPSKVLVHVKKLGKDPLTKAHFTQSILNYFDTAGHTNESLYVKLDTENRLVVSDHPQHDKQHAVCMTRPTFCPVHHLKEDQVAAIPADIRDRGVDCGAATLLESCDGKILLTRRAQHLRTFPGIWVPPGGHIEFGETLQEAALREFHEETGLHLTADMMDDVKTLAMWESVYPPKLSLGLPKRHHVVVYLYTKLKPPHTAAVMQQQIALDPEEVGACAWLDQSVITSIVKASEECDDTMDTSHLPQTFSATVISRDNPAEQVDLPMSILLNTAPLTGKDMERVSTGTKFALSEWLKATT